MMMPVSNKIVTSPRAAYAGPERRQHPRLVRNYSAKVQGIDADGRAFEVEVSVDNVSASGFYASLPVTVERGAALSTTIRFSTEEAGPGRPRFLPPSRARPKFLAVHGTVRRSEPLPDGACGVGVEFQHHQFL